MSDPATRDHLIAALAESGCVPAAVGQTTLEVIHPDAVDADEAQREIVYFLRAWQAAHPEAELTYAAA